MSYTLTLFDADDASPTERAAAERRFRQALEAVLGDAALVWPMHSAHRRLVGIYGEAPEADALTEPERLVFEQWQAAELAAVTAAFGPHRYMGDAMYELGPG